MRKCVICLLIAILLFSSCGRESVSGAEWQKNPFVAEVEGINLCGAFRATVTWQGDGVGAVSYHAPDILSGITVRQDGKTATLEQDGMVSGNSFTESTLSGLLMPLWMFTPDGEMKKIQNLDGQTEMTFTASHTGEVKVTVGRDGIPLFLQTETCRFSVFAFRE